MTQAQAHSYFFEGRYGLLFDISITEIAFGPGSDEDYYAMCARLPHAMLQYMVVDQCRK